MLFAVSWQNFKIRLLLRNYTLNKGSIMLIRLKSKKHGSKYKKIRIKKFQKIRFERLVTKKPKRFAWVILASNFDLSVHANEELRIIPSSPHPLQQELHGLL